MLEQLALYGFFVLLGILSWLSIGAAIVRLTWNGYKPYFALTPAFRVIEISQLAIFWPWTLNYWLTGRIEEKLGE